MWGNGTWYLSRDTFHAIGTGYLYLSALQPVWAHGYVVLAPLAAGRQIR